MNEDYTPKNKNGYLSGDGTPEEQEIAQARKKKIEGFRLSIDDLAEEPAAFNQDETELFNRRMPVSYTHLGKQGNRIRKITKNFKRDGRRLASVFLL